MVLNFLVGRYHSIIENYFDENEKWADSYTLIGPHPAFTCWGLVHLSALSGGPLSFGDGTLGGSGSSDISLR